MFGLGRDKDQKKRDEQFIKWLNGEINSGVLKIKVASGRAAGVSSKTQKEAKRLCKLNGIKIKF